MPHPERFALHDAGYEASMAAHAKAVASGLAGYMDPITGLFVMTASHLLERPCCERGCRHCPWVGATA